MDSFADAPGGGNRGRWRCRWGMEPKWKFWSSFVSREEIADEAKTSEKFMREFQMRVCCTWLPVTIVRPATEVAATVSSIVDSIRLLRHMKFLPGLSGFCPSEDVSYTGSLRRRENASSVLSELRRESLLPMNHQYALEAAWS